MPKLPTEQDLGPSPSLESRRGIATYDDSPLAKGAVAIGQGAQAVGNALTSIGVQKIAQEHTQEQTLLDAHAQADLLLDLAQRKRDIGDATAAAGLEEGQRAAAQARADEIAAGIKDPTRAALFKEHARTQIDALGGLAKNKADELTKDADLTGTDQKLVALSKTASEDKDPNSKQHYIDAGSALIDEQAEKGHITQLEAQRRKEKFAQDYSWDSLSARPPLERLAQSVGGFRGALINYESSNNPRTVNKLGYAGLYQFGAPLLQTLGLYTPGENEDLKGWSRSSKDAPGKWSGQFNIPGFPGVRTLADFRENPEAQHAAFDASTAYYDKEIASRKLDQFIGKTVNGVPITREGIYTAAHLGGIGGTDSWLRGGNDAADQNGTKISKYARMAAQAGPGAGDPNEQSIAKYLTPQQRLALKNGATRDLVNADRAAQNAQANETATVKQAIKDDEGSILTQGAPRADLTPERVSAALGPAAAEQFTQNRAQAVEFHHQTHDWDQIPVEEIRARLGALKPAPGAPGFENAQRLFSTAQEQAQTIQKEREIDPAAAASKTPKVRAALQGASLDRPESYQAVAKERAIAQEQLKIPDNDRRLATKDELRTLWKPVAQALAAGDDDKAHEAMKATLEKIGAAFGEEKRKDVAAQMIQEAGASKAAAAMSMDILDELSRGRLPSKAQAKAYDQSKQQEKVRANTIDWAPVDTTTQVDPETGRPVADIGHPNAPSYPTPTARAIETLRANPTPERIAAFNQPHNFGPGAAETVLKALNIKPAAAKPAQ